jgi:hypothetical protein
VLERVAPHPGAGRLRDAGITAFGGGARRDGSVRVDVAAADASGAEQTIHALYGADVEVQAHTLMGHRFTRSVELTRPVGDRRVVDGATGTARPRGSWP